MDENVRIIQLPERAVTGTDCIPVDDEINGTGRISVNDLIEAVVNLIPEGEGGSF